MKSDYVAIKDFDRREIYAGIVEKQLMQYLWNYIYKYLFKVVKKSPPKAKNYINPLLEALKNNEIYYIEGGFRATKKFSIKTAKILKENGAVWDRYSRTYKIQLDRLPAAVSRYIERGQAIARMQLMEINNILQDIEYNLPLIVEDMVFYNQVETILNDAGEQITKNAKHINIIAPELDAKQKAEIARTYTENMDFYIKNWAKEEIPKMREQVGKMVMEGQRQEAVQEFLIKSYNIGAAKAKFLAQNETSIMISELKKVHYKKMGFSSFIWNTIMDGRERPLHGEYNGKRFTFDDPPIIDKRTGQKGLPGQSFNCRCSMTVISTRSVFE